MCDNWNLVPLGVGIERVKEELKQFREEKSLFILTADTVKNAKEAREIVNQFFKAPQGILLTTEYGLAYLERRVEFSAVVSLDSLFALPDFKIQERVYHLLEAVRSSAKFKTIIQTRASSFTLFTHAVRGDTLSFYKEELAEREFFKWPPATTVIKVSIEGKKESVALLMQKVLEKVAPFELEVFPAFVPSSTLWSPRKATREQRFTLHGLLRLPKGGWVEETLKAKLLSLPPEVILEVDPESIL